LKPDELTRGSGNMNFIRQLGGASGTNLIVVMLQLRHASHGEEMMRSQNPSNGSTRELMLQLDERLSSAGLGEAGATAVANDYVTQMIDAQALALAFQDCFLALAVVFTIAIVPAFVLGKFANR
jgi:hypothetical protein